VQKKPKSAKMPNQNFQGQTPSKKAKFDLNLLFSLTQGQIKFNKPSVTDE